MRKMRLNYIWMGMVGMCLLMSSCKKNKENETNGIVFKATIEQAPDSRTSINPQGTVGYINWSAGDQILINNGQTSAIFTLTTGAGTGSAEFTTTDENFYETGSYVATYPNTATINGSDEATFVLPNTQNVSNNPSSFAEGANPMVAVSTTNDLAFKNVCGGLCVPVQGWGTVSSLVLTSKTTSEKLWGTYTVNPLSNPTMNYSGNDGSNTLTLNCGGVTLQHNEVAEFYIVLPQNVLANGFTLNIMSGNTVLKTIETTSGAAVVERNVVKRIGTVTVPPEGSTGFTFSTSATQKVYFSHGNLQYQACSGTWQFAGNQYDYVGDNPGNNTPEEDRATQCDWIDLFGWGTSGVAGYSNHPESWQPWTSIAVNNQYYAYCDMNCSLSDNSGLADWGKNPVLNGGNDADYYQWRTPSIDEWVYVLRSRTVEQSPSQVLFAMANVAGVNGMIVLPDEWAASTYTFNTPNDILVHYNANVISESVWANVFETNGAVFLPAAGDRDGISCETQNTNGDYWSSTASVGQSAVNHAQQIYFCPDTEAYADYALNSIRRKGRSVRFVINAD